VVVPPFSMRWMRSKKLIERQFQAGTLPQNAASVVFKVPSKATGQKLLTEMWVAGNKLRALPFIANRADTLCGICSQWGHSDFRCQAGAPACAICAGLHLTEGHQCEVATCGKTVGACSHTTLKCPNCGGKHLAQDAKCKAKTIAIGIARGTRPLVQQSRQEGGAAEPPATRPGPQAIDAARSQGVSGLLNWVPGASPATLSDWIEDVMEISEVEASGTAPPMAV